MGYPTNLLADGETVQFQLRPHFRALLGPILFFILAAACLIFGIAALPGLAPLFLVVAGLIFFIGVVPTTLRWLTTQYVFTDRRIITRAGILTKRGKDMPLVKVNNVDFSVPVLGRILNYGTLTVDSAAESGGLVIKDVPNVEVIQRRVYELYEADQKRRHGLDNDV